MSTSVFLLAIELSLCWTFVRPAALLLQSPGFSGGKLRIESDPQGASISINGKRFQQLTNSTFVVSQGDYKVEVSGSPGNLQNCSGDHARNVHVEAGKTVTLTCTASGFQQQ